MKARIITGLVLGSIVIALIVLAPAWGTYALLQLAVILSANEFYRITIADGTPVQRWAGNLTCAALLAVLWFAQPYWPMALVSGVLILLMVVLFSPGDVKELGPRASALLAGYAYVGLLLCCCLLLVKDYGKLYLLLLFGGVFFGDTGAYFSGRFLGNKKLYPRISPKKTWAGAYGGLVASIVGIFVFNHLCSLGISHVNCAILGVGVAVLEQIGDLAESLFKRAYDVKDSGQLLPGHGGLLDRIDGVLFAGPFMWVWLHYFAQTFA